MNTYRMASLRRLMADVVIVRECKHGQVRVLYGDGPEEATPDSVKGLIEAASLQVQSDAAAQQEP